MYILTHPCHGIGLVVKEEGGGPKGVLEGKKNTPESEDLSCLGM